MKELFFTGTLENKNVRFIQHSEVVTKDKTIVTNVAFVEIGEQRIIKSYSSNLLDNDRINTNTIYFQIGLSISTPAIISIEKTPISSQELLSKMEVNKVYLLKSGWNGYFLYDLDQEKNGLMQTMLNLFDI